MHDVALMLLGAAALLAPAAFFWINSRNRKAAERKWQQLDKALAACEIASLADDEEVQVSDNDLEIIESARFLGLLTEHRSLRKHVWHTHYSLNDSAKGFRWAGMFPENKDA